MNKKIIGTFICGCLILIFVAIGIIFFYKWHKEKLFQISMDKSMIYFRLSSVQYELDKFYDKNKFYPKHEMGKPNSKAIYLLPEKISNLILKHGKGNPYDIYNRRVVFSYVTLKDGYAIISCGPDKIYENNWIDSISNTELSIKEYRESSFLYDPTNGIYSRGDYVLLIKGNSKYIMK